MIVGEIAKPATNSRTPMVQRFGTNGVGAIARVSARAPTQNRRIVLTFHAIAPVSTPESRLPAPRSRAARPRSPCARSPARTRPWPPRWRRTATRARRHRAPTGRAAATASARAAPGRASAGAPAVRCHAGRPARGAQGAEDDGGRESGDRRPQRGQERDQGRTGHEHGLVGHRLHRERGVLLTWRWAAGASIGRGHSTRSGASPPPATTAARCGHGADQSWTTA